MYKCRVYSFSAIYWSILTDIIRPNLRSLVSLYIVNLVAILSRIAYVFFAPGIHYSSRLYNTRYCQVSSSNEMCAVCLLSVVNIYRKIDLQLNKKCLYIVICFFTKCLFISFIQWLCTENVKNRFVKTCQLSMETSRFPVVKCE